jgi:outer membrane protein OmpU
MKHILMATTALVASASIASADVAISGFAEIGVQDDGSGDIEFFQDIDVTFSMTAETDGGLSFGASVDLDENDAFASDTHGGSSINVSGGFGTITMGDTDGATDWAMTETAVGGSIADDHTSHVGYNGNAGLDGSGGDGQILRWNHTMGALGFAVSLEQDDDGAGDDNVVQAGLKYSMDMGGSVVGFGLGFSDGGTDNDLMGISLSVASGGVTGVLNYSDGEAAGVDGSHMGVGLGFTMDALTIGVNYGEFDIDGAKDDGFGMAVNYDMGGGAVLQLGYASENGDGDDQMSMGLALSF